MKTLKNRKWYQASSMLSAGKKVSVVYFPVSAFQIVDGNVEYIATDDVFAFYRDGLCLAKKMAKATSGVKKDRLILLQCDKFGATEYAKRANQNKFVFKKIDDLLT